MIKFSVKMECIEVEVPEFLSGAFTDQFNNAERVRRREGLYRISVEEETRLKTWLEEADETGLFDRLKTGFSKDKLNILREKLKKVRLETIEFQAASDELSRLIESRVELSKELSAKSGKLQSMRERRTSLRSDLDEHNRVVAKVVDEIIDMGTVVDSHKKMKDLYASYRRKGYLLSKEKEEFRQARDSIDEEVLALESAGWVSKGLSSLADMNYNRFDRENPADITIDHILDMTQDVPALDEQIA